MGIRDAFIFPLSPPPIPELGTATGFNFRLQDRGGTGHDALLAARNQLLGMAAQEQDAGAACGPTAWRTRRSCSSTSTATRPARWASSFDAINATLSTALGSAYVNDFPNDGRLQRVVVQADAPARMQPDDLLRLNAHQQRGPAGAAVGLRHHALDHRPDADRALQRLPGDAHRRRRGAGLQHRRGDGRDGAAGGAAAAGLRLRMDRASRARKSSSGSQAPDAVRLLAAGGVPVPGRAVRELVDPARR